MDARKRANGSSGLRIKPRLAPRRAGCVAGELDPVMQAERPVLPELHDQGLQAVAGPIRRSWDRSDRKFRRGQRDRLLEGVTAFERRRLLARPGADLGEARAG